MGKQGSSILSLMFLWSVVLLLPLLGGAVAVSVLLSSDIVSLSYEEGVMRSGITGLERLILGCSVFAVALAILPIAVLARIRGWTRRFTVRVVVLWPGLVLLFFLVVFLRI